MDRIAKALQKMSVKDRERLKEILRAIAEQQCEHMDIQKIRGRDDIYRVRKGDFRVIYRLDNSGKISILAVARRSDTTYNQY